MKNLIQITLYSAVLVTGTPFAGSVALSGFNGWDAASAAPRPGVKPPAIKPKFNNAARPKPAIKPKFNKAAKAKPAIKPKFNKAAKPTIKPKFNKAAGGSVKGAFGRAAGRGAIVKPPRGPVVPRPVRPKPITKPKSSPVPKTPKRVQPFAGKKYPLKKPLRDVFKDAAKNNPQPKRKDQRQQTLDRPGPTFPNPGI